MKRIYNSILLSVLVFAAVGCLEDEFNPGGQLVGSDDEVQFGLSLNDPSTKTIYGPENDFGFPLYWSEGDKIQIASPQCVDGRNLAEYLVTPQSGQSYAVAMTKTGDYGLQWGSEETADFYSIYPSNGTSWPTLTSGNVVAKLNIASEQSANLVLTPAETTESKDNEGNTVTTIVTPGVYQGADMGNVIMYADKTTAKRGDVVKLSYKPYSTILEFELGIAHNQDSEGNELPEWGTVKVVSMTLTAPAKTYIAGDFTLEFKGSDAPTIIAAGNNSNSVKLDFRTQPILNEENQTLKAKLPIIPISGIETLDGWKVAIEVLEGNDATTKTHTKTFSGSGEKTALAPGKIHKIKLPKFSEVHAWNPPTSEWIPTLEDYKNIYLTELSIPGAWYALGKDDNGYQATGSSATELWNAGVRAFAVECRAHSSYELFNGDTDPIRVVASGQGSKHTLGGAYIQRTGTPPYISTIIQNIAGAIKPSEFGVLILSYADGGSGGHRDKDYDYFIPGIQKEISEAGISNIYSGEISPETTVSAVLGKLIIKINVDARIKVTENSYDDKMTAMFSYNPFIQDYNPLFSKMYWMDWDNTYREYSAEYNSDDFWWCFSSANRTQVNTGADTAIPTYKQRQSALQGMIQHSKQISADAGTNVWFYFNAGGTEATSSTSETNASDAQDFAKIINPWLLDVIKLKANGGVDTHGIYGTAGAIVSSEPSPMGIVMFNQCLGDNATYYGKDIINEIIQMNNKFPLLRNNGTKVQSLAPSYASGMDTNDSAFGWD